MTFADDVGYKIGGAVPVWAAAVGLSAGYLVYDKRKKKAQAAATAAASAAQTDTTQVANQTLSSTGAADEIDPTTGMTFAQEQSVDPATGQSFLSEWESANNQLASPYLGSTPLGSQIGQYSTNQQWAEAAENYLISKGSDPSQSLAAVQNYINGNTLNTAEKTLLNLALSILGAPPESVGSSGITDPTTAGTTAGTSTPGYGIVDTVKGQMVILGVVGQPGVYQVAGGAPVYWGNTQSLQQGGLLAGKVPPGNNIYTPVQYANLVSAKPAPITYK